MPDDHSKVVPLLPIPNRTVKRLSADDSADTRVKVGHRQALTAAKSPSRLTWAFCLLGSTTSSVEQAPHWLSDVDEVLTLHACNLRLFQLLNQFAQPSMDRTVRTPSPMNGLQVTAVSRPL